MQSSTVFVLLALVALFSFSSASSTAGPSTAAASTSTPSTGTTGLSSSSYIPSTNGGNGTVASSTGRVSSSSGGFIATSSAGFATGTYAISFQADLPSNINPNVTYNSSSPLIQNLTNDIGTFLASTQSGVSAATAASAVTILAINGNPVNTHSRRLLANGANIAFIVTPVAGTTFNVANAATAFAQAASAGSLTLPSTGATVPPQSVPTPQNVGYQPPVSSSGQGGTGAASSQASAGLAVVALAAGLALLL